MIKDYGYISPTLDTTNYFSGSLPKIIVNPTGDWRPFVPKYEPQFFDGGGDTNDCTIFGLENTIQTYFKGVFGIDVDYSERYVSNGMNRDNSVGADPHLSPEWVRKNGVINQELLPMPSSLAEYRTPRPLPQNLLDEGKKWEYELQHEYVFANSPNKKVRLALLREHLKYSPLGLSVTAWREEDGLYVDDGKPNTHWCTLIYIDENDVMYVYDSYDLLINGTSTALIKKLHPDHHIEVCKRYLITPKVVEEKLNWIERILKMIAEQLGLISTEVKKKDMTPFKPLSEVLPPIQKYLWDTKENSRHSVRVICDEEGLTVQEKNIICACIQQESQFNPKAIGKPNFNGTKDYGLCQYNDGKNKKGQAYWIGPGAVFKDINEVLNNPEKNVRIMVQQYKAGNIKYWASYSTGAYKKWL